MKKIIKTVVAVLAVVVASVLGSGEAFASKAFTLSPMSQKIVLVPGETYRGGMTVSNPANSTEEFNYAVKVSSYYPSKVEGGIDDYSGADYVKKTNMNQIVDWTTIDNPKGTLQPNEENVILFSITVPADAPAGGQYMALMVGEDAELKKEEGIKEIMQMAHVIYAEVAGETTKKGSILENNVPSFSTSSKYKTSATVRNDGNIHAEAKYTLQVWPLFSDEEICTNEESPEDSLVLPDTKKYYSQECNLPMVGIFRVKQVVKIFGEESIVEKTVIICPLWLIFVILFAIVLLIAWIVAKAKKRGGSSRESASVNE